jgi:hypothetical protein
MYLKGNGIIIKNMDMENSIEEKEMVLIMKVYLFINYLLIFK